MQPDPSSLLATLAQSSAAIVAIVGGFLISRLVALSSEREGLRRQLVMSRDRLSSVSKEYDDAHDHRLHNSKLDFFDWVIEAVVTAGSDTDWDALLDDNIPKGSSADEMHPYLEEIKQLVVVQTENVRRFIKQDDVTTLSLSDLEERGLAVSRSERTAYEHIVDTIAENELPAERSVSRYGITMPVMPIFRDSALASADNVTNSRRLDESIREEQGLGNRRSVLAAETERLADELQRIGRPVGVISAIVILSLYSLLGIVAPVIVLATSPDQLSSVWVTLLVAMFIVGLFAVLAYILWYARTLNDPVD